MNSKIFKNLYQLQVKTARITAKSGTSIDHNYVTTEQNIAEVRSPMCGDNDYSPICITWLERERKKKKSGCHMG